jgi:hypothetical protein
MLFPSVSLRCPECGYAWARMEDETLLLVNGVWKLQGGKRACKECGRMIVPDAVALDTGTQNG